MKRKALAGLALLLPLTISLCACGGSAALNLNANWYRFPEAPNVGGTYEKLEYEVTFDSADGNQILSYEKGSYTTELEATMLEGLDELGYRLHSELSITGKFTVGNKSESFTDAVVSDVYFKALSSRLQPVKSEKSVKSTSPVTAYPASLETAFRVYEYTCTVDYDDDLDEAEIAYKQTKPAEKESAKTVSVGGSSVFYDNEQLLFVLRGLNLDSAATLKTINPLDFSVTNVGMTETPSRVALSNFTFEADGETVTATEENPLNAYSVSFSYGNSFPGETQTLVYAANTRAEKGANLYRNVLLEMHVPILQNLGLLHYKLVKAEFTK